MAIFLLIIVGLIIWWIYTTIANASNMGKLKKQIEKLIEENQVLHERINEQNAKNHNQILSAKKQLTAQIEELSNQLLSENSQQPKNQALTTQTSIAKSVISNTDGSYNVEDTDGQNQTLSTEQTIHDHAIDKDSVQHVFDEQSLKQELLDSVTENNSASKVAEQSTNDFETDTAHATSNINQQADNTNSLKNQLSRTKQTQKTNKDKQSKSSQKSKLIDGLIAKAIYWLTTGNVPVKIGMLVLTFAVMAFLRYATTMGWIHVPIQAKLLGVAGCAFGALAFAWKKRISKRSFALVVQGGSIGIILLVIFSAVKMYGLMSPAFGFVCSVAMVALTALLSVQQNAKLLAIMAISAGFLAPIWLSDGSGNHVVLFSYYAVLNVGILVLAWFKPWRELILLGFGFTYLIGGTWGGLNYQAENFASTEPFVVLFFLFYVFIPLRLAFQSEQAMLFSKSDEDGVSIDNLGINNLGIDHSDDDNTTLFDKLLSADLYHKYRLDSALLFGTPLATLGLQVALLLNRHHLAISCVLMGLVYAMLAYVIRHKTTHSFFKFGNAQDSNNAQDSTSEGHINKDSEQTNNLFNTLQLAYIGLSTSFITLAIPIGLTEKATILIFALEGAGAIWLSVRGNPLYRRLLTWLGGLVLHCYAFFLYLDTYNNINIVRKDMLPVFNGFYLTSLLLVVAFVFSAWISKRAVVRADNISNACDTFNSIDINHSINTDTEKNETSVSKYPISNAKLIVSGRVLFFLGVLIWTCVSFWEIVENISESISFSLSIMLFSITTVFSTLFYHSKNGYKDSIAWIASCLLMICSVIFALLYLGDKSLKDELSFFEFALAWLAYASAGLWLWKQLRTINSGLIHTTLVVWVVTLVMMLSTYIHNLCINHTNFLPQSGWLAIITCLPTFALVVIDCLKPEWLARLSHRTDPDYSKPKLAMLLHWQVASSVISVIVLAWLFGHLTLISGDHRNWWLPLLNSNDFVQLTLVALAWFWLQGNSDKGGVRPALLGYSLRVTLLACLLLFTISMITIRFVYHFTDSSWSMAIFSTAIVQMSLTLVWSILGVVGWIVGSKRLSKPIWLLGAVLMAVALIKLVLVDRGHLGNLFGIASFFAYGLLCVIVGYFAPIPPAEEENQRKKQLK